MKTRLTPNGRAVWQCSHSPRLARRRCVSSTAGTLQKADLLAKIYAPTAKINSKQHGDSLKSLQYLLKGGFVRQVC